MSSCTMLGTLVFGPAEAFTPEQLAELYDINVLSTQRVNRVALPQMKNSSRGFSSGCLAAARRAERLPYLAPYFASKAGMDAMAVQYARELALWASKPRSSFPAHSPAGPITSRIPARPAASSAQPR